MPVGEGQAAGGVADSRPEGDAPDQYREVRDLIERKVKELLASL